MNLRPQCTVVGTYPGVWRPGVSSFRGHTLGCIAKESSSVDDCIRIHFLQSDVVTHAQPGTMLCEVAEEAGVVVSYGCGSGQCGMCEMEIKKYSLDDHDDSPVGIVVRSCVTPVPRNIGYKFWEVSEFVDAIWGQDLV